LKLLFMTTSEGHEPRARTPLFSQHRLRSKPSGRPAIGCARGGPISRPPTRLR